MQDDEGKLTCAFWINQNSEAKMGDSFYDDLVRILQQL